MDSDSLRTKVDPVEPNTRESIIKSLRRAGQGQDRLARSESNAMGLGRPDHNLDFAESLLENPETPPKDQVIRLLLREVRSLNYQIGDLESRCTSLYRQLDAQSHIVHELRRLALLEEDD